MRSSLSFAAEGEPSQREGVLCAGLGLGLELELEGGKA